MSDRVERRVKLALVVDSVEAAFAFVVGHMDAEGLEAPTIHISPLWVVSDAEETRLRYECSIEGFQEA